MSIKPFSGFSLIELIISFSIVLIISAIPILSFKLIAKRSYFTQLERVESFIKESVTKGFIEQENLSIQIYSHKLNRVLSTQSKSLHLPNWLIVQSEAEQIKCNQSLFCSPQTIEVSSRNYVCLLILSFRGRIRRLC